MSEEQVIGMVKQHESGVKTADLCREHGISAATLKARKRLREAGRPIYVRRFHSAIDENQAGVRSIFRSTINLSNAAR